MKHSAFFLPGLIALVPLFATAGWQYAVPAPQVAEVEKLGAAIFHDARLSRPQGQSCASCHSEQSAFRDPRPGSVSPGAAPGRFGDRNAPSLLYAMFVPELALRPGDNGEDYSGGLFWDGRANSLSAQVASPIANPLEMNSSKSNVVNDVCSSLIYGADFRRLYGAEACPTDYAQWVSFDQIERSFNFVADAIAGFERSRALAPFSSKFDKVQAGFAQFNPQEALGFHVFKDSQRGNCAACHTLDIPEGAAGPLFTDFSYDNLGIPGNPKLRAIGHAIADQGLFTTTKRAEDRGRFRTSTLRNIAQTAPYGHNGYFETLEQVVDFYSTRDLKPRCKEDLLSAREAAAQGCWPRPEVEEGENMDELGKINLSPEETQALLAFLRTLTDGYK